MKALIRKLGLLCLTSVALAATLAAPAASAAVSRPVTATPVVAAADDRVCVDPVWDLPGINANAVAEYTIALLLAQARRLVPLAADGGSTDSGPHYLGSGTAKTAAAAVARDLRVLLRAAARAGIPLIIGSCGTSGTDSGVDWVAGITRGILAEEGLTLRVATIYSEQQATDLKEYLGRGLVHPLPPPPPRRRPNAARPTSSSSITSSTSTRPPACSASTSRRTLMSETTGPRTVADLALEVRSKTPGPSW